MTNDNNGVNALNQILDQTQQINDEYNTILEEVRTHEEEIAKASADLGKLRTRMVIMRDSVRTLSSNLWRLTWDTSVSRQARTGTQIIQTLQTRLDDLAWRLFDFRERS